MLANVLAYRFVAGKLAIIFQLLILTSRKSQNFDFNRKSAMSDMQCCGACFFHFNCQNQIRFPKVNFFNSAPIFESILSFTFKSQFALDFYLRNKIGWIFISWVELNVRFWLLILSLSKLRFLQFNHFQLSENQSNFQTKKIRFG